jgi:hypothetical protein
MYRRTDLHAERQSARKTDRWTTRQTNRQGDIQMDRLTHSQTYPLRQIERQTDTHRNKEKQTDKKPDRRINTPMRRRDRQKGTKATITFHSSGSLMPSLIRPKCGFLCQSFAPIHPAKKIEEGEKKNSAQKMFILIFWKSWNFGHVKKGFKWSWDENSDDDTRGQCYKDFLPTSKLGCLNWRKFLAWSDNCG